MIRNSLSVLLRPATASAVAVLVFASTACSSKDSPSSSSGGASTSPTATHTNSAQAAITSQEALTAAVKRALQAGKGSAASDACDADVLDIWESTAGAGYIADKTTGDPQGIAAKVSGGRAFLDDQGRLVDNADPQQTQAYATWLTDPAVVHGSFKRFGPEMLGYLNGMHGTC